ncbi:MAG: type II toxin-antitoxin system HicA family toxin [Desulfovibrio sp.]|nr:type II toxin-antitoxin system HicA family toxin [Desulfovibrio sp.]
MNSNARRILNAIYANPVNRNLSWQDVEMLFVSLGAILREGAGSRIKFELGPHIISFHRPHNPATARTYQIKQIRKFLSELGIRP